MDIPEQQEQSAEERIGSMIGKVIVLALIAFFVGAMRPRWLQSWEYSDSIVPTIHVSTVPAAW
jgi:hypothetical protein